MHTKRILGLVREKVSQRRLNCLEGQFVPWDTFSAKKRHFKTFRPRVKVEVKELGTEKKVNLLRLGDIKNRKERPHFDAGAGFFACFSKGPFGGAFTHFHKASGQRPKALTRLDGSSTQQDLRVPNWDGANHRPGIDIMDGPTGVATVAFVLVAGRNFPREGRSTN